MRAHPRHSVVPILVCLVAGRFASAGSVASAAEPAPTCDGRPATIVGTGGTVTGTNGDDVIVATDAYAVDALGGDDLVCATNVLDTYLGPGDDTYLGTATRRVSVYDDQSLTGTYTGTPGHDVVTSTAPSTHVEVNGTTAQPDSDRVTARHLVLGIVGPAEGSYTSQGPGDVTVDDGLASGPPRPVTIDVPHGSLAFDGGRATISGFTTFAPDLQARSTLTFRGSNAGEKLVLPHDPDVDYDVTGPLRVMMGGGDDEVDLDTGAVDGSRADNVVRGGTGDDVLALDSLRVDRQRVVADLARGRTTLGGDRAMTTSGFEGLVAAGQLSATVTGTPGPNDLTVTGCSGRVYAGGGDDVVHLVALQLCPHHRPTFRVSLGRGDDTAYGSARDDVILGGPGRDVVHGGRGRDRCVAERTTSCERR